MNKLLILLIGGICAVYLTGCNATKGAGKDLENTGKNIQQGVDRNQ
jgi:predicted small secreted protein